MWIPLPETGEDGLGLLLRIDPFPPPLGEREGPGPIVAAFINDRFVDRVALEWNPKFVRSYEFPIPRGAVEPGWNRLVLMTESLLPVGERAAPRLGLTDWLGFKLWYVQIGKDVGPSLATPQPAGSGSP